MVMVRHQEVPLVGVRNNLGARVISKLQPTSRQYLPLNALHFVTFMSERSNSIWGAVYQIRKSAERLFVAIRDEVKDSGNSVC
jgi:hypothetical protein